MEAMIEWFDGRHPAGMAATLYTNEIVRPAKHFVIIADESGYEDSSVTGFDPDV